MMRLAALLALAATPALAAGDTFFSLDNTDFIVVLAFVLFATVLIYFKIPQLLGGLLDKRAERIRSELNEARSLREEAQTLLASYERKQSEVKTQVDRIVEMAGKEAAAAADAAKADLAASITRRLAAAEDQIASAEAAAVRTVRDRAIAIAVAAAGEVVARQMDEARAAELIDSSIDTVNAKLH